MCLLNGILFNSGAKPTNWLTNSKFEVFNGIYFTDKSHNFLLNLSYLYV